MQLVEFRHTFAAQNPKNAIPMKRTELQIPFFVLLLVVACSWIAAACGTGSGRLIAEAEALAYVNPDSAARVLALADTSALSESQRAHLALTQALIH